MTLHNLRKEIEKYNKVINRYQHRMQVLTQQQNTYAIIRDRLMAQLAEQSKAVQQEATPIVSEGEVK